MTDRQDCDYMTRALVLARRGLMTTDPNPRVGCVLVKHRAIIAEGWHQWAGQAHAEVDALAKTNDAYGSTAYVTLEPCSHHGNTGPCSDALIAAGVQRVVVAMLDPNPLVSGKGIAKLKTAGIDVSVGVLAEDAEQLNRGFCKRMRTGYPFITSKLAMSLDGRTAMASGESKWITSSSARLDVHRLRAQNTAILTGINTVLMDDPLLNVRLDGIDVKQPVRVILDTTLRFPLGAKIRSVDAPIWVFTASNNAEKITLLQQAGIRVFRTDHSDCGLSLDHVFKQLGQQQINHVWVEAGARLNGSLMQSKRVDEWVVYMAPCLLGDQARGLFHLPALERIKDRKLLKITEMRQIGPDIRMTFTENRDH